MSPWLVNISTLHLVLKVQVVNLFQDIEHVIYHFPESTDLNIVDIIIETMITDEGLMDPFGIGEMVVSISYQIE